MTYEFEGKTEKEAIETAAQQLGLQRDQFDVEILESQKNTLFKKGYVKICVHTIEDLKHSAGENKSDEVKSSAAKKIIDPVPQDEFEKRLLEFVQTLIEKMGYEVKTEIIFRENKKIGIKLQSESSSILIAGHLGHEEVRVVLDTENYRIRREESLVRLAYNTADKVRQTHRSVLLEPMNPFERRLIHTTLNDIPDIETKSDGDGLYKQVRVIYNGVYK